MVALGGNRCIGATRLHTLEAMLVGLPSCCRRNSSQSDQTGKSFLLQLQKRHFLTPDTDAFPMQFVTLVFLEFSMDSLVGGLLGRVD